jgi:NAD(P)-dependent dehydrogenase (short-subunit alcohol dehydrogenase family)
MSPGPRGPRTWPTNSPGRHHVTVPRHDGHRADAGDAGRGGPRRAERAARDGVPAEEVARRLAAATSIGRLVTAEEVADVITFLASPRSAAITGDAIAVGGGTRGPVHS